MHCFLSHRRLGLALLVVVAAGAALLGWRTPAGTAGDATPDDAAVERARATVQMLDDMNKGYVVHITDTYVKAQERTPAAKVAKKVFKLMEQKGWGTTRLLDATGEPVNKDNLPRSEFEKRAVAQLKSGKSYFEEVGSKDGKPVLRAATVVPAVMRECVHCHQGVKEGELLGALVYEVPVK
jgi:hypothetical protein